MVSIFGEKWHLSVSVGFGRHPSYKIGVGRYGGLGDFIGQ